MNEQRYCEYEKMLISLAENDPAVRKKLGEMNIVPKDRKISNVVLENNQIKQQLQDLQYENEKLRD